MRNGKKRDLFSVLGLLCFTWLLFPWLTSCSEDQGYVTLIVDADPMLRSHVRTLVISSPSTDRTFAIKDKGAWPLVTTRKGKPGERGLLTISARGEKGPLVERRVDLTMPSQHRVLTIHLSDLCIDAPRCASAELTCGDCGKCVALEVDGAALPRVDGEGDAKQSYDPPSCKDTPALDGSIRSDGSISEDGSTSMDGSFARDGSSEDRKIDGSMGDSGTAKEGGMPDLPTTTSASVPFAVSDTHVCAIRGAKAQVYCLGDNAQGQLGTNDAHPDWRVPVLVRDAAGNPLEGVLQVATGRDFSCALDDDHRVYCWGSRVDHRTGTRNRGFAHRAISVVLAEGGTAPDYLPLENIIELSAGQAHACAIDAQGQVYCWGANGDQQIGVNSADPSSNGARPVTLPNSEKGRLIACGFATTCVVTRNEKIFCWGLNDREQAGLSFVAANPSTRNVPLPRALSLDAAVTNIKRIAAGDSHFVVLADERTLWSWGNSFFDQLGRDSEVCEGDYPGTKCSETPAQMTYPSKGDAVFAGSGVICAITNEPSEVNCTGGGPRPILVASAGGGADVALDKVTFGAGAFQRGARCLLRSTNEIYCYGGIEIAGASDMGVFDESKAVLVSFPE